MKANTRARTIIDHAAEAAKLKAERDFLFSMLQYVEGRRAEERGVMDVLKHQYNEMLAASGHVRTPSPLQPVKDPTAEHNTKTSRASQDEPT